jgi:hypothetical protein
LRFHGILCRVASAGWCVLVHVHSHGDNYYEKDYNSDDDHGSSVVWLFDGCATCGTASCFPTDLVAAISTLNRPTSRSRWCCGNRRRERWRWCRGRKCGHLFAVRTFSRLSGKLRWIFDVTFTVLAAPLRYVISGMDVRHSITLHRAR